MFWMVRVGVEVPLVPKSSPISEASVGASACARVRILRLWGKISVREKRILHIASDRYRVNDARVRT